MNKNTKRRHAKIHDQIVIARRAFEKAEELRKLRASAEFLPEEKLPPVNDVPPAVAASMKERIYAK